MTSDEYPEIIPPDLTPIDKFTFSIDAAKGAKTDLDLRLEAARERLSKIVDRFSVELQGQTVPVINKILTLTHDPEELMGLSTGLARVASFIKELDELEDKQKILEVIEKDPSWFTWAFGDFTSEVEDVDEALKELTDLAED